MGSLQDQFKGQAKFRAPLLPFVLTLTAIVLDQITKALVVGHIPFGTVGYTLYGNFLWIVHDRNLGAALSFGANWPEIPRRLFLQILPLIVLVGAITFFYLRDRSLSKIQYWTLAGILGGGFGNLIDRFFRPEGVVDFVSVAWFGFPWSRFPTFNVADSFITVCGFVLLLSVLLRKRNPV